MIKKCGEKVEVHDPLQGLVHSETKYHKAHLVRKLASASTHCLFHSISSIFECISKAKNPKKNLGEGSITQRELLP